MTRVSWTQRRPRDCPAGIASDLETAGAAALAGGLAARPLYRDDDMDVRDKRPGDPVTEADHAANDAILEVLAERAPLDPVRSEESPPREAAPSDSSGTGSRLWIVDPLDGTKEFIARNGEFAVMVGLAAGGAARLGAVLLPDPGRLHLGVIPARGEAERGGRAWAADVRWTDDPPHGGALVGPFQALRISGARSGAPLTIARSRSHPDPLITTVAERLDAESILSGSVGVKCALIAEGRADLYLHPVPYLKEWDTCAPEAVLRGAGGQVTDCAGLPLTYGKPKPTQPRGIFAARPDTWNGALSLVRETTADSLGFRLRP